MSLHSVSPSTAAICSYGSSFPVCSCSCCICRILAAGHHHLVWPSPFPCWKFFPRRRVMLDIVPGMSEPSTCSKSKSFPKRIRVKRCNLKLNFCSAMTVPITCSGQAAQLESGRKALWVENSGLALLPHFGYLARLLYRQ